MTLPTALLDLVGPPGDPTRETCVRVWAEHPDTERQRAVDTHPATLELVCSLLAFVKFSLQSELEMRQEIAEQTASITARATLQIEQNNTTIADIKSEGDQAIARLDREIERH